MGTNQNSDVQWPWPARSIQHLASGSSMKGIFKSVISSVIEFYCRQEDEACALVEERIKKNILGGTTEYGVLRPPWAIHFGISLFPGPGPSGGSYRALSFLLCVLRHQDSNLESQELGRRHLVERFE